MDAFVFFKNDLAGFSVLPSSAGRTYKSTFFALTVEAQEREWRSPSLSGLNPDPCSIRLEASFMEKRTFDLTKLTSCAAIPIHNDLTTYRSHLLHLYWFI
jgi:hypothetical protein